MGQNSLSPPFDLARASRLVTRCCGNSALGVRPLRIEIEFMSGVGPSAVYRLARRFGGRCFSCKFVRDY
jgi:hypothetical protein